MTQDPSDVPAGMLIGWTAPQLVTKLGMPWIDRIVALLSRISDPLLAPVWNRVSARVSPRR